MTLIISNDLPPECAFAQIRHYRNLIDYIWFGALIGGVGYFSKYLFVFLFQLLQWHFRESRNMLEPLLSYGCGWFHPIESTNSVLKANLPQTAWQFESGYIWWINRNNEEKEWYLLSILLWWILWFRSRRCMMWLNFVKYKNTIYKTGHIKKPLFYYINANSKHITTNIIMWR